MSVTVESLGIPEFTMLRELYWEDVKRLEAEWDLDVRPWEADFHR
jgi:hypothetical protein